MTPPSSSSSVNVIIMVKLRREGEKKKEKKKGQPRGFFYSTPNWWLSKSDGLPHVVHIFPRC